MNMNKQHKRICCILLVLILLLSAIGCSNKEETVQKDSVTIVACSDYQNPDGNHAGSQLVKGILKSIKGAGYEEIDGFLCAGDYDFEYGATTEGIESLKGTVQKEYETLKEDRMIFVQGNHDKSLADGVSTDGVHDTPEYGVFVFHEESFPYNGGNIAVVEAVAFNLENYLKDKVKENNTKPIFVISHLPLHYTLRTRGDGGGAHSEIIFEVLNKYAEKGQNIIYLFGHNHSGGYDDYLGGSSVYLTKGDTIYIAQLNNSTEKPNEKQLQFTYLNAGYVGWRSGGNFGSDKSLTMTVFHIEENIVKIERFDTKGSCNLKQKGVWDKSKGETATTYGAEESYLDKVYASPQILQLGGKNEK